MVSLTEKFLEELVEFHLNATEGFEGTSKFELIAYLALTVYVSFEQRLALTLPMVALMISRELYKRKFDPKRLKRVWAFLLYPLALGIATTVSSFLASGEQGLLSGISLTYRSVAATLTLGLYVDRVGLLNVLKVLVDVGVPKGALELYEHTLLTVSTLAEVLVSIMAAREVRTLRPMKLIEAWKHQLSGLEVFVDKVSFHLEQKSLALEARRLR